VETAQEVRQLVAMCLWDVFSNEHGVVDRDGRLVDIGSWRGAAGFLAAQLNRQTGESQYGYADFYMGSFWGSQRADLTPVYEMIFRRLKEGLFDWRYGFPKLQLIEFPSDIPNRARSYQLEKMKAELNEAHRQAIENSKRARAGDRACVQKCLWHVAPRLAAVGVQATRRLSSYVWGRTKSHR